MIPKVCVFAILAFLAVIFAGCTSLEEYEQNVIPTATPAPEQPESEPTQSPIAVTTNEIPLPGQAAIGGYVERYYGYLGFDEGTSPSITLIDAKTETDSSGRKYISGKIRNEGTGRIEHLTVVFDLYNANGNLLGNSGASVDYLGSGKTWKFNTDPFDYADYQFFELVEIFAV